MTLVDHGTPVISSRQWAVALSPNAAGDGWNYIVQSYTYHSPSPTEWIIVHDLTGVPAPWSSATQFGATKIYSNSNFLGPTQQLRAPNGRIFFPQFLCNTTVYDPTTETVSFLPAVVETPPINPGASTAFYSARFDTTGDKLYFATQESQERPSCVVVTDTNTLAQTVLGYVGSGALSYTTYGYYIVVDTITSTKFAYVVYGENPWQLWALDITTGTATKLYEVSSTGFMTFVDVPGQGWTVTINTIVGSPSNVQTKWWCLDGAIYPYTVGNPPPLAARNVTPATNPLVAPPGIDFSGGIGVVGWRPNGSTGPYAYINYPVVYSTPQVIEALVNTPDGVLGNAEAYQGFFRVIDATGAITWFGVEGGMDISEGPRLNVQGSPDRIFMAGYPNGVLYNYNPANAWQASVVPTINPVRLGYYGPGNTLAAIKYANRLAWSPSAGASGRLYCAGLRDRTGTGAGIGYWDATTATFNGTYASPLDTVTPRGLVALETLGEIVMSTTLISGSGSAPIYVFDHDLNLLATQTPIAAPDIGSIFPTSSPSVVCGVMQSGANLAVYRHDVQSNTLLAFDVTSYVGTVAQSTINQADGSVWVTVGDTIVRVDPDTLAVSSGVDVTTIAPVGALTFYGTNLYMASGARLWSSQLAQSAYTIDVDSGPYIIAWGTISFSTGVEDVLDFASGAYAIAWGTIDFSTSSAIDFSSGVYLLHYGDVALTIGTGELYFDLPTIPTQGKRGTMLIYSDSPFVIQKRIPPIDNPDPEEPEE